MDHELERLSAELDAEVRAEQAGYEQLAHRSALRDRVLADALVLVQHRGDVVSLHAHGHQLTGRVVHAAGDLAVLATARGQVDVNLGLVVGVQVVERAREGGVPSGGGAATFRARLAEHELAGTPVALVVPGLALQPSGVLDAVARDHVVLGSWLLPLEGVLGCRAEAHAGA